MAFQFPTKVIKKALFFPLLCSATMNSLAPDIQNELFRTARRRPACFLFSGGDTRAKTLASEVLAAHYELYVFRVDLSHLVTSTPGETGQNLKRIFGRVDADGDLLFFDRGEALSAEALPSFLQLLQRYHGVVVVSVSDEASLDPKLRACATSVIRFPPQEDH